MHQIRLPVALDENLRNEREHGVRSNTDKPGREASIEAQWTTLSHDLCCTINRALVLHNFCFNKKLKKLCWQSHILCTILGFMTSINFLGLGIALFCRSACQTARNFFWSSFFSTISAKKKIMFNLHPFRIRHHPTRLRRQLWHLHVILSACSQKLIGMRLLLMLCLCLYK